MKHVRYGLYIACSLGSLIAARDAVYTNALTKAFFHQSSISDKVVCYFTKEPICNQVPRASNGGVETEAQAMRNGRMKQARFIMPSTELVGEARTAIPSISGAKHKHYTIIFNEVTKPLKGVEVAIEYDPRAIGFEFETFDAIHTHKGVVFKFHHKDVLQELNTKTDHILQYASNVHRPPTIIIDNGHGGDDAGKIGHFEVKEKDINLIIGKQLAHLLKKKGYKVLFTRASDVFVSLDARTTLANRSQADLFLSIHANGAANEAVSGIETYWAPQTLLKTELYDLDVTSRTILRKITEKRDSASKRLAYHIHTNVIDQARKFYQAKDRNIKESISQVLLGTDMPAALIELGFLSNKEETRFLMQPAYQQAVAQSICAGIESYLKEV